MTKERLRKKVLGHVAPVVVRSLKASTGWIVNNIAKMLSVIPSQLTLLNGVDIIEDISPNPIINLQKKP